MNRLLWTPTKGQDVTRSLFPLHGSTFWPEIAAVVLLVALSIWLVVKL